MTNALSHSGASPDAIQFHYDTGAEFFKLWLGPTMAYTAARFADDHVSAADPEALDRAQIAKFRWHLNAIGCRSGFRLLDIGCGWGGLMRMAVSEFGASECLGLTLSREQDAYIALQNDAAITARLMSYEHYEPDSEFDGIASLGAFEHFAKPGMTAAAKIEVYEELFRRCHRWLKSGGKLSLQMITWGDITEREKNKINVQSFFPESELPEVSDVVSAAQPYFELTTLETRSRDYEVTFLTWLHNLRTNAWQAKLLVGDERYQFYERCMQGGARLFQSDAYYLCRFQLTRRRRPCR